jgi:sorting nexin-1/2
MWEACGPVVASARLAHDRTRCGELCGAKAGPHPGGASPSSPTSHRPVRISPCSYHLRSTTTFDLPRSTTYFSSREAFAAASFARYASAMSSGGSPPLSLVLGDDDGASQWGDEFQQRSISTSTPPISLPEDNAFKDSTSGPFLSSCCYSIPAGNPNKATFRHTASQQQSDTSKSGTTAAKSSTSARRMPRRHGRQAIRAEAVDDPLGPLGPLGGDSEPSTPGVASPLTQSHLENPPMPPVKEAGGSSRVGPSSGPSSRPHTMEGLSLEDGDAEARNNSGGPSGAPQEQQLQPVAQKPMFDIAVGDPHKVGDLTSAHTVYQVRTKV